MTAIDAGAAAKDQKREDRKLNDLVAFRPEWLAQLLGTSGVAHADGLSRRLARAALDTSEV